MNEKDQNFDQLKRLLKLKQHEVPPPGYFNDFSGQVIARIRAGETLEVERYSSATPWLVSFLRFFEGRPGLVGGFATSLCLLLLLTVVFTEHSDVTTNDTLSISGAVNPPNPSGNGLTAMAVPTLAASDSSGGIVASTNPVTSLQPSSSLFGQPASASLFQPAGFAAAR